MPHLLGAVNGGASSQYKTLISSRYIYRTAPWNGFPSSNGDTIETEYLRVFFTFGGEIYFESFTDGISSGVYKVTGTAYNPT